MELSPTSNNNNEPTNPDVVPVTSEPAEVAPVPTKRKKNYLNNADMLQEVKLSLAQNKMTDKLANMMILLTNRYGSLPRFSGYSFLDDMKSYAIYMVCRTWNRFNPERGVNAFAFFTQCIKHSFYQYLNKEKHQRNIRDKLLITSGLNPSNTFIVDYESDRGDYDCGTSDSLYAENNFIESSDYIGNDSTNYDVDSDVDNHITETVDELDNLDIPPTTDTIPTTHIDSKSN